MKRREFLRITTSGAAGAGLTGTRALAVGSPTDRRPARAPRIGRRGSSVLDLSEVPNFCSHEHWSLTTIRSAGLERKRGVTPPGPVDVSFFIRGGHNARTVEECRKRWKRQRRRFGLTGDFQCVRRGIQALHGQDLAQDDPEVWAAASASIAKAYEDLNGWTPRAMEQTFLSELLRTVIPQYYTLTASDEEAEKERGFTNTLLRLDPILTMFPKKGGSDDDAFISENPDWWASAHVPIVAPKDWRDEVIEVAGIVPRDAASWRAFLGKIFEVVAAGGCCGLKDMAAKMRPLEFAVRSDAEVPFDGVESFEDAVVLQDWIWHECCKLASDLNWPWQVHTGTTTLQDSSPLPLEPTIKRYPKVKWVMLHCWPYLSETGFLARRYHNVWVDTCWLPLLNPHFFRQAILEWIQYVPLNKIHCGHDAHSVEAAAGSSLFMREILEEILPEQWAKSGLTKAEMMGIARDLLHNNAVDVYKVGERVD